MKKFIVVIAIIIILAVVLVGCNDASQVQYNMSRQADHFDVYRKVTVINLRKDTILLECEGYLSIKDSNNNDELAVIIQTGKNEYKMHYFYFGGEVIYLVEQLEPTNTTAYYWDIRIHAVLPHVTSDYVN